MSVLSPLLPLDPSETAWSYTCRLAAFHTGDSLECFLADVRVPARSFMAGEADGIARLAEVAGIEPTTLARASIRLLDGRTILLRGEAFSPEFVPACELRVCPLCLRDDEAASPVPPPAAWRQQIAWRLRPVTSCPTHEVGLIDLAPGGYVRVMPELKHLVEGAGGLGRLVERARARPPTALQRWIHDRLEGRAEAGGPWLAAQTIEQGVRTCEVLGAELLHGRHRSLKSANSLTRDEWDAAGARGLEVAREGAEAVRAAVGAVRAAKGDAAVQAGPEAAYGLLYVWLHFRSPVPEAGPIRDIVRDHILENLAIEPGEMVLGQPVVERRMHSERSLADVLHTSREEARRRLVRVGLMPRGLPALAAARLAFPARQAERLCADVVDAVPLPAAANLLSCTRAQVDSLSEAGILAPFLDHGSGRSPPRVVVAMREVADLRARLKELAVRIEDGGGTVDLEVAARDAGLTYGHLLALVLEGRIGAPLWLGFRSGLSALRLRLADLGEVASLARLPEDAAPP